MDKLNDLYFKWLVSKVSGDSEAKQYRSVLEHLYFKPFEWVNDLDENLTIYGIEFRNDFYDESIAGRRYRDINGPIDLPCSILEVMVYLAISAEVDIMQNSYYGDRTSKWFWFMMDSLGLKEFDEVVYDEEKVEKILENFIERRYSKHGKGGLFSVKNSVKFDMKVEPIWKQMNIFLAEYAKNDGEI